MLSLSFSKIYDYGFVNITYNSLFIANYFINYIILGSIPGRVIPKTWKMVLDASLLNIQHYMVWIKGKVE